MLPWSLQDKGWDPNANHKTKCFSTIHRVHCFKLGLRIRRRRDRRKIVMITTTPIPDKRTSSPIETNLLKVQDHLSKKTIPDSLRKILISGTFWVTARWLSKELLLLRRGLHKLGGVSCHRWRARYNRKKTRMITAKCKLLSTKLKMRPLKEFNFLSMSKTTKNWIRQLKYW